MSDKEREEICETRKGAGLNCNGCQYKEKCQGEKVDFVLPEDIKPGTKQAKIYWELKSGKTAAEIIKTKEFASESVYIVARKHFPNAISKPGNAKARVKKAAGKIIDKENYFGKSEILEKMIKDGEKLQEKCKTITVILKDTKAALEEGKIIETYNKLQKMIDYMEAEK